MKEASTGEINLEDDDPRMVKKMIDFLYKTRYDDDRTIDEEDLKDLADQHSTITSCTSSAGETQPKESATTAPHPTDFIKGPLVTNAKVYILGDKYDIPSLKEVAVRKYEETVKDLWNNDTFAESAKLVYDNIVSENDMLKPKIIKIVTTNMSQLLQRDDFVRVLRSNGDIATDVLNAMLEKVKSCANCGNFQYSICNSCHKRIGI